MRPVRVKALLLFVCAVAALGCGKKAHAARAGHGEAAAANAAPPTPDNTPIAALRTPAGWLLVKGEHAAPTPTPAASPASNPKP